MVSLSPHGDAQIAPLDGGALLTMVLDALEERMISLRAAEPLLLGFAAWLGALGSDGAEVLNALAGNAAAKEGAGRHYHDIAVLGFACARQVGFERAEKRFRDGLTWMKGRRFFLPNQAPGFEADGIAIMGIAAGVIASDPANREENQRWLGQIITLSLARAESQVWDASLLLAARIILSCDEQKRPLPQEPSVDLAAALAAIGFGELTDLEEQQARITIVNPTYREIPLDRAAVQAVALRWLMRRGAQALPMRATVSDVLSILRSVPHALKRWPWEKKPKTSRESSTAQRWDLQNEYHVQSLLWTILAPIFPDLEDEEYLKSLGHKHPRVDLAIPSLGLIVEVKFILEGTQSDFARIISEISADTGLYLSVPSEMSIIVAFVWDHSRSSDQHAELLNGLRRLRGIVDAVVVPRPGRWETFSETSSKKKGR